MDTGLRGKVVLVTGASGGLGIEIVKAFAAEGARLILHYCHNHAGVLQAQDAIPGVDSVVVKADLTREEDVVGMFREAEAKLGPVEILIANAGIWEAKEAPIHEMELSQWNKTISTNLTSVFLCAREFFRGVIRHGFETPSAVLIGSTAGVYGEAGHADYAATKAALSYGFLLTLKNELARIAPRGRINAVNPGWTVTAMAESFMNQPEQITKALQTIALRKVGRPTDVANAVVYLASAKCAGHTSGQILFTSGGMEGRVLYSPSEIDLSRA